MHKLTSYQLIAGLVVLTLGGCVNARVTPFDPSLAASQRTPPERIRFYDETRPQCAFTEIGRVTAETEDWTMWDRVVRKAREKASQMGGDAVIGVREHAKIAETVVTKKGVSASEKTALSGTVIRFDDAGCTR